MLILCGRVSGYLSHHPQLETRKLLMAKQKTCIMVGIANFFFRLNMLSLFMHDCYYNIYLINEHSCNFYVLIWWLIHKSNCTMCTYSWTIFLFLLSVYTLKAISLLLNRHHIHSYTQETVPKNYFKIKICTPAEL